MIGTKWVYCELNDGGLHWSFTPSPICLGPNGLFFLPLFADHIYSAGCEGCYIFS